jgi:hypothetical protein
MSLHWYDVLKSVDEAVAFFSSQGVKPSLRISKLIATSGIMSQRGG